MDNSIYYAEQLANNPLLDEILGNMRTQAINEMLIPQAGQDEVMRARTRVHEIDKIKGTINALVSGYLPNQPGG